MQSLWLIFQLLFCLFLGFILAKRLPVIVEKIAFQLLPYFSYILLVAIAFEFAQTFNSLQQPVQILSTAMQIAFATSIGAFLCCYLLFKGIGIQTTHGKVSLHLLRKSCLNISYAFLALFAGYALHQITDSLNFQAQIQTWYLLLFFMWMIGLDLAYSPLDRSWLNWKILMVPVGCIFGSVAGVLLCALWLPIALQDLLMLSQGYGFYSMSGIVVSELRNTELGSIALMNDLFREIFAILLMYILGWRYPRAAISAAGATAMDVTLPMVKQACGNDFIPHAMVSGFVLSILAPIAVSVLAAI
ncbi:LysO family transporter [Acinetobacter towneri]|uniref:lysine exporter LysO family protein n=1 Tax=Acinetobacter towneri TaxID=202956 RepID=UPI001436755E|nr:lysine exporter LysO family protein [Acinetobacter towneri]MCA4813357.1 lysine exporter LysO family protein [Acinetobacter towneri]QIV92299.1 lysine exporter LysO family protein [Acinetobacter towneri]